MTKVPRGFALLTPEQRRVVASRGGKSAHARGTAHQWTSDEAREAGRKGGVASHKRKETQVELPFGATA